jgi:hypothetical protein
MAQPTIRLSHARRSGFTNYLDPIDRLLLWVPLDSRPKDEQEVYGDLKRREIAQRDMFGPRSSEHLTTQDKCRK